MTKSQKHLLREEFRMVRSNLSEKKKKIKSLEICKNFYANISIRKQSSIAFYMATENEPDLKLLMEMYLEDGHHICLPCIEEKNAPMIFRKYLPGATLKKNKDFNFLEPDINFETIIPDVIITPLVAFDAACNRLGQGSGYYDITIDHLKSFKEFISVGCAFKEQQASYIPTEKFDQTLDAIITDERVII